MSGNFVITLLEYLNILSEEDRRGEERGNMLDIGLLVFSERLHNCLCHYRCTVKTVEPLVIYIC